MTAHTNRLYSVMLDPALSFSQTNSLIVDLTTVSSPWCSNVDVGVDGVRYRNYLRVREMLIRPHCAVFSLLWGRHHSVKIN